MNPGYAGRTELPENLKPFFRPISMMVPDYALIAEIMLYSSGFQTADVLGKKLTLVHKLCSEQLSSQDHYDYGMRAVKHSVSSAKKLKLLYPDEDETNLLAEALSSLHFGKLVKKDISQFEAIMKDVFPGYHSIERDYNEFKKAAAQVCESLGLKSTEDFISRVVLTYRTLRERHGIMVIGKSGTGKTTILKVLQETLGLLSEKNHVQDGEEVKAVDSEIIFIKTMNGCELYGSFDSTTKKWTDGKLTKVFRKFSEQNDERQKWMIFDGPVDAIWVENLNQVLDDNKKLPLANGELIPATKNMRFIFNAQDVACASPATVSRCGFIHLSEQFVDPHKITESVSDATELAKFENKNIMISSTTALKEDILKHFSTAEERTFTSSTTKTQVRKMLSGPGDILIINNINHPLRECFGAQPPLEVLREYLENGKTKTIIGFFDRQGVQISPSLLRHFEIVEDISLLKTSQKLDFGSLQQKLSRQSCNLKEHVLKALDLDFLKNKSFFSQMTENNQAFYSSLIFSLCVFHGVVTERASHVPDGWNIPYAFKPEDLVISMEQLESLSFNFKNTESKTAEIQTLRYLIGECNYGGRISDDKDRRLCLALLDEFIFSDIAEAKFVLNRSFFTDLNLEEKSTKLDEIFSNESLLSLMSLNESALKNQPLHSAENIFKGFSNFYDYLTGVNIVSVCKESPFSSFVTSELERYKKLVNRLISSMEDFSEAINGRIQFRESHKTTLASFAKREVPEEWKRNSFARSSENKSMRDFVQDLKSRIEYVNAWAENGTLKAYDISKMFFPQVCFRLVLSCGLLDSVLLHDHSAKFCTRQDSIDRRSRFRLQNAFSLRAISRRHDFGTLHRWSKL
jgi:energy-coupling factor transporter ATP-binding protein EcfA2